MASVFLSHSSADSDTAAHLALLLRSLGVQSLFLDFDPEFGIPPGRNWERELYSQLRQADAVIYLMSSASIASRWCFAELAIAREGNKLVIPVALQAKASHPLLADSQTLDMKRGDRVVLEGLRRGLQQINVGPQASLKWDSTRPPYPGLSAYSFDDAGVFFGRDLEVGKLLRLLESNAHRGRVIAVIGPSGSGKSSLVSAGLLPRLAVEDQQNRWIVLPRGLSMGSVSPAAGIAPGENPLGQLAQVLAQTYASLGVHKPWRELRDWLSKGTAEETAPGLVDTFVDLSMGARAQAVLLVVDQAEELVTRTPQSERQKFLRLLQLATRSDSPLRLLMTIRAEYLAPALGAPELAEVIEEPVLLGPLSASRLMKVVEEPARRAGIVFQRGLIADILADTGGSDALPLLAHTLRRLWELGSTDRIITHVDYEHVGKVPGALRVTADDVLEALTARGIDRDFALRTLLRLVTISSESMRPSRRRMYLADLSAGLPNASEVIQAFVDARLLKTDLQLQPGRSPLADDARATIEVVHEALLRNWPPLSSLIDKQRDELRLRSEWEALALDWMAAGRRTAYLLAGERLDNLRSWTEAHPDEHAHFPHIWDFLAEAAKRDDVRLAREADLLASSALDSLRSDPELSLVLSMKAVEAYTLTPRALTSLAAGLAANGRYIDPALRAQTLAEGNASGARVAAWVAVAWSSDSSRLACATHDGHVRRWNARTGAEEQVMQAHSGVLVGLSLPPGGCRVASAGNDGAVWEGGSDEGHEHLLRGHRGGVWALSWSPCGQRLASAGDDGTVRVWRVTDSTAEETVLSHHAGWVRALAWSPEGGRLASSDTDSSVRIWDVSAGVQ